MAVVAVQTCLGAPASSAAASTTAPATQTQVQDRLQTAPAGAPATSVPTVPTTRLVIHYYRPDGDYAGWNLWVWAPGAEGASFAFQSSDSFGRQAVITLAGQYDRLGFIVRQGNWEAKDTPADRFVHVPPTGQAEIWLVQGDPQVYASRPTLTARLQATLDSSRLVTIHFSPPLPANALGAAARQVRLWATDGDAALTEPGPDQPPIPIAHAQLPLTQSFRWMDEGRRLQFVFVPRHYGLYGLPDPYASEQTAGPELYLAGSMNNWLDSASGTFRPDPAWRLHWDQASGSYQLACTVGNGPGQVNVGMEFKFVCRHASGQLTWYPGGTGDNLVILPPVQRTAMAGASTDSGAEPIRALELVTAEPLSPSRTYTIAYPGYAPATVQVGAILDTPEFTNTTDELGAVYTPLATEFRLWAPTARTVKILLYDSPTAWEALPVPMAQQGHGVWSARVAGDLNGRYYVYEISHGRETVTVPDPYSRGAAANSSRTLIVDQAATNPPGWAQDRPPVLASPVDAVIYEAHVRDLTIDPSSGVQAAGRGKFLGLAQEGSRGPQGVATGLDHLTELGITHLHLLPIFDSGTIDELDPNSRNWGYDPVLYNTPEGSYATAPDGIARIREFKELVAACHRRGIGVIMDVVYNHTLATGLYGRLSVFDKVVPGYFYRHDSSGAYSNGSGCGNELATERPMVRRFIVDSVRYWTQEYHIDGMRFDLMALIDRETLAQAVAAARAINPSFLAYGEPWTAGPSPLPPAWQMTKGSQRGMGVAVFNDGFRDAIKGPWNDDRHGGFANGVGGREPAVLLGIAGGIDDFAADPTESVQYVTCHDGMTLWDRVCTSNSYDSFEDRVRMVRLAHAMVLTSQGIPFIQEGEEFLRTKGFVANSYNANDQVNAIDWSLKAAHRDVLEYFRGLIALRRAHPSFRLRTAAEVRRSLTWLHQGVGLIAFQLSNDQDPWPHIIVIYNGSRFARTVPLPQGEWVAVVAGSQAGLTPVQSMPSRYTGQVNVPAFSAMVLHL